MVIKLKKCQLDRYILRIPLLIYSKGFLKLKKVITFRHPKCYNCNKRNGHQCESGEMIG